MKTIDIKDDDDIFEFLKEHNTEDNGTEAEVNLESNVANPRSFEKVKEDDQPTMGPGLSHHANKEETHPLDHDDSEDEDEHMDRPQPLTS